MNTYIGCGGVDVWTLATDSAEFVADCILDSECKEIKTAQRAFNCGQIDLYCQSRLKPVGPGQAMCDVVNVGFTAVLISGHLPQNAAGDATFKIGTVTG